MDQREPVVVLEHADLEQAHDVEALDPRQGAGWRHRSLRADDHDAVADANAERTGELGTQNDAEFARFKIAESARTHVAADVGDGVFERRIDAADQRTPVDVAGGQHCLAQYVGGGRHDMRIAAGLPRHVFAVADATVEPDDLDVRRDGQNAIAQLILESVHDRQHDDQRRDAKRDAGHGGERDERDESVAARTTPGSRRVYHQNFVGRQGWDGR